MIQWSGIFPQDKGTRSKPNRVPSSKQGLHMNLSNNNMGLTILDQSSVRPDREYAKYKIHKSNRFISDSHAERLYESMAICDLQDLYPGIVSPDNTILDAQHRYIARKAQLKPLYMMTGDDLTISDIVQCNALTRSYSVKDYMNMYAKLGVPSYKALVDLAEECSSLQFGFTSYVATSQNLGRRYAYGDRQNGYYVLDRAELTRKVNEVVTDILEVAPKGVHRDRVQRVALQLAVHPMYDHERMIRQIEKYGDRLVPSSSLVMFYQQVEEVYNHQYSARMGIYPGMSRTAYDDWKDDEPINGLEENPKRELAGNAVARFYATEDYDAFTPHPATRSLNERYLHRLTSAIRENNLLRYYPIIVNDRKQVLDGNCRLQAAKAAGVPIWFTMREDVSMLMIALAVVLQRNWGTRDYIRKYVNEGDAEYIKFQELLESHPGIQTHTAAALAAGRQYYAALDLIRSGNLVVRHPDRVQVVAELFDGMKDKQLKSNNQFQYAICHYMALEPAFKPRMLIRNLNHYGTHILGEARSKKDMIRGIEDAYNYRRQKKYRFLNALHMNGSVSRV